MIVCNIFNIMNVFTATFDQFNVFLLNKSINFLTLIDLKLLNGIIGQFHALTGTIKIVSGKMYNIYNL